MSAGFFVERFRFKDRLKPTIDHNGAPQHWYQFSLQCGFPACPDIERDGRGNAKSWSIPQGWPTYADLVECLCTLGYKTEHPDDDFSHFVKCHGGKFMPADWKQQGRLFALRVPENLRLFDMSRGEYDATEKQYHNIAEFRWAEKNGFDGVIIDDAAQVDGHGNVGHRSYGFFEKTIARLEWFDIPACHFSPAADAGYDETPELAALLDAEKSPINALR
jgi:hypothetical protein